VELLHVHASIGVAATATGASIALCVLATKVLTGAAEVVGEGGLLRLAAVLIQTGAMLVGMGHWPAWSGGCSWMADRRSTETRARTIEYRDA